MIIPPHERSGEPLKGERVIYHPDMIRAAEWVLEEYEPPERDICIFVPCSRAKPFHKSPSHRIFDNVIFRHLTGEQVHVVVFGTCGITPRELDMQYPFMDYRFMMGRCDVPNIKREFHKMESNRLARYLIKTRDHYKHRIAYCIGDFRSAMEKAVEISDIHVDIVPGPKTLEKMFKPDKKFNYGSLNQPEYLQDLDDIISKIMGLEPSAHGLTSGSHLYNDIDWYIL